MEETLGTARTADVLDPSFLEGIDSAPIDEVRRRRDVAVAERDFQSYLRRLIQTNHDLLAGERRRRASGAGQRTVVDRVKEALSEPSGTSPRASSRGEAMRLRLGSEDLELADSIASRLAAPAIVASPESLDDRQLEDTITNLERAEHVVSADRGAVFRVHDRLQDELKRRYLEDPTLIPSDV